jgi:deazaflavin-dependent oxidoreductase (nitroreductase family)
VARNRFEKPSKSVLRAMSFAHRNLIRVTKGKVGGTFRDEPMILLTTVGRKTGKARTHPLCALPHGDGWLVVGSNGGNDWHPGWYVNLQAHPDSTVRLDDRTIAVRARDAADSEYAGFWSRFVEFYEAYAGYAEATDRTIPVVVLERVADPTRRS